MLRKMVTFIVAGLMGLTLASGFAPRAEAADPAPFTPDGGYMVNVHEYGGDRVLSLVLGAEHRWTVKVNGRVIARVAKRDADSTATLWFSTVVPVWATHKVKRVVLKRDGQRVMFTYLSK